ncbi:MAG: DUF695 domain-containing protein [Oceanospirillaceae bacterium]|nr:DUF695 domain-containing protein [Oceanospirillaceae bacterium]
MAQYDNGPGSTTLNMDLIKLAPKKDLPFIVITGVTTQNCRDDGFPKSTEFDKLYNISDSILEKLKKITKTELAGTFTYQCERLDYIYVADTLTIRTELTELYKTEFPNFKNYINIKADKDWKAYLQFLYPNEETQEFMANEKVLIQLRQAGDNLDKPRQVDHWIYFADEEDKISFMESIKKEGYKIEDDNKLQNTDLPFQLRISRIDSVNPNEIYKITLSLRKMAKKYNGEYDGWETFVIKE